MTALRELREAAGVPRIVLADRAGVSAFRLYQAEAGRCELTATERTAIDRVLGPVPVTKRVRGRKFDSLMAKRKETLAKRILRTQGEPKDQEEVRQLVKRGEGITVERLGVLGKALLERDLIRPPKDPRVRIQIARAGLEAGGLIGSAAAELHLHTHQTLPPVVEAMLLSKMAEISGKSIGELSATVIDVPLPPDPIDSIDGEDKNHG
jgi:hypothetical protein